MSRFLSKKYSALAPYVPGEQPRERAYIKLNTNESPFPPSAKAVENARRAAEKLMLYPDPEYKLLREAFAAEIGVKPSQVIPSNGSDEILDMAFAAYCGESPAVFPDITYGFYRVFANKHGAEYREIPLDGGLAAAPADYYGAGGTVFLPNPNAPTGILLPLKDIESIVAANPDNAVVIDEAYIDFGGESCVGLINKYENLLVTRTFSKSRSMAGARLGFGVACESLIRDLETLRFSTNPYNVNALTAAAGIGSLADKEYFDSCRKEIILARGEFTERLEKIGFSCTDSKANFVFAKHKSIGGRELYEKLRANGVLTRYFPGERTGEYLRITVGSAETMRAVADVLQRITEETK